MPARRHHGPRLGADVRHASTRRSRPTARFTPTTATLLVDTYNTLKSGVPNAIRVFQRGAAAPRASPSAASAWTPATSPTCPRRRAKCSTRRAGRTARSPSPTRWTSTSSATCSLQGAQMDSFGVGERLITASSRAGVRRRLQAGGRGGRGRRISSPRSRSARTSDKITNPALQEALPLLRQATPARRIADYLTASTTRRWTTATDLTIFDPERDLEAQDVYRTSRQRRAAGADLQRRRAGLQASRRLQEIQRLLRGAGRHASGTRSSASTTPTRYYVDLSQKLWDIKQELLTKNGSH